jgi:predicted phage terminase large subunit-like protein
LWPEWFSLEHWQPFQQNRRTWASLFQQKPSPEEGSFFKLDWFRRYKEAPDSLHKYMTSDHAPGGEVDSDYSGVRVWGIDPLGDIYLLDGFRSQETMDVTCVKAIALIKKHRPFAWFPENDNNWKSVSGFVTKMMREKNIFTVIEPIGTHGGNKSVKAQPFQAMAAMGRVWIKEGVEGDEIIEQYLKFPNGKNDDEVDMGSLIGRALDMAHPAIQPREPIKKQRDVWDRAFNGNDEEESWKTA